MEKEKNGLLLNREILTLINLKILITYSGTVAIKNYLCPKLAQGRLLNEKNQCILRKKRNVETISLIYLYLKLTLEKLI